MSISLIRLRASRMYYCTFRLHYHSYRRGLTCLVPYLVGRLTDALYHRSCWHTKQLFQYRCYRQILLFHCTCPLGQHTAIRLQKANRNRDICHVAQAVKQSHTHLTIRDFCHRKELLLVFVFTAKQTVPFTNRKFKFTHP